MKKLPKIDPLYWLMIVSANTIGESGGDLISQSLGLGYGAGSVALVGLYALAVIVALWTESMHPSVYWITIILSSTAGTTMSDWLTRTMGLGYGGGTFAILCVMGAIFLAWQIVSPKHSLEGSFTRTTEFFYWSAILCSSTLGTAFGDFISNGTRLGFAGGTLVLIGILAVLALVAWLTNVPKELCYWLGIIVTHPLGATMGDYATKDEGFGLGNFKATVILAAVFLFIIGYKVVRTYSLQRRPKTYC